MKKIDIFPCSLWEFDIPVFFEFKDDWIKEVYAFKNQSPSMLISNRGGWQSPDLFLVDYRSNNLRIILNKIVKVIENNLFATGYHVKIDGMWYNINHKDCYNDLHDHPGADLAGIFYIKVPDPSDKVGDLVFMDPFNYTESLLRESINPKMPIRSHRLTPTEGKFYMFPAHLLHRVEPNQTNEDRISIAFNLNIIRPL